MKKTTSTYGYGFDVLVETSNLYFRLRQNAQKRRHLGSHIKCSTLYRRSLVYSIINVMLYDPPEITNGRVAKYVYPMTKDEQVTNDRCVRVIDQKMQKIDLKPSNCRYILFTCSTLV